MGKRKVVEPRAVDIQQAEDSLSLLIHGQVVPAGRPRVTRWGTYYPKTYQDWIATTDAGIEEHGYDVIQTEGLWKVHVTSIFKRPIKLTRPTPRADLDNIVKGPLDMITKKQLVWLDDKDIIELSADKRYAEPGEAPWQQIDAVLIKE